MAALANEKTVAQLSVEYGIHQTLINKWKAQLKEGASAIFAGAAQSEDAKKDKQLHELHAKIGELIVERDFLARAWEKR